MSKKYQAVFFDLDGTLLPMDNDMFIKAYFKLLAKEVEPLGYEEKPFLCAMQKGVDAMVGNNGSQYNCQAFWSAFSKVIGKDASENISKFDNFYTGNFKKARAYTYESSLSKITVETARKNSGCVVLATNPVFPLIAVTERMSWVGLAEDDFDYITCYTNSHYCKPNPDYYREIGARFGLDLTECLMVGNNTIEDIRAGAEAGMDTFLLGDCIISDGELPVCKKGSFEELIAYLSGGDDN